MIKFSHDLKSLPCERIHVNAFVLSNLLFVVLQKVAVRRRPKILINLCYCIHDCASPRVPSRTIMHRAPDAGTDPPSSERINRAAARVTACSSVFSLMINYFKKKYFSFLP